MKKQVIISIGREFGSAGHIIAEELAKRFDLPFYDSNLLKEVAKQNLVPESYLRQFDEKPAKPYFLQKLQNVGSTPEEELAEMQFNFLRNLSAEGKSFVIVGRCSENILKDNPALISIFVLADEDWKVKTILDIYSITEEEARRLMNREDAQRKSYHNYYCGKKWGDSRNYDITINTSRLGIQGTADYLEKYIRARMGEE